METLDELQAKITGATGTATRAREEAWIALKDMRARHDALGHQITEAEQQLSLVFTPEALNRTERPSAKDRKGGAKARGRRRIGQGIIEERKRAVAAGEYTCRFEGCGRSDFKSTQALALHQYRAGHKAKVDKVKAVTTKARRSRARRKKAA